VLADYGRLRVDGVDCLGAALPRLAAKARAYADARPDLDPVLCVVDGVLVANIGRASVPARVHARAAVGGREIVFCGESVDLGAVPIGEASRLGSPGRHRVRLEAVALGVAGRCPWAYGVWDGELEVAERVAAAVAAEEALRAVGETEYQPAYSRGIPGRWFGRRDFDLGAYEHQVRTAPPRIGQAARALVGGLTDPFDKAEAVERLLAKRKLCPGDLRPIAESATAAELSRSDAAVLAAAMLGAVDVDARIVEAKIDGTPCALCVWRHDGRSFGVAPWPAGRVEVTGGVRVDNPREAEPVPPITGWTVLQAYETIARRRIAWTLAPTPEAAPRQGARETIRPNTTTSSPQSSVAPCPRCGASMTRRHGRYGPFLSCTRYPACKGSRPFAVG
jgi:hypothetical protein